MVIVVACALLVGAGTWSLWNDAESDADNRVRAGTLDLSLDGGSERFALTNARPGDTAERTYALRNVGSTEADRLSLRFRVTENDSRDEPADPDLASELTAEETASLIRVQNLTYGAPNGTGIDLVPRISDTNANGYADLQEAAAQAEAFADLPAPAADGASAATLTIRLGIADDDAAYFDGRAEGNLTGTDEDIMADGVDVTVEFTLDQDASR